MHPTDAPLVFVAEDDPLMLELITTRLKLANFWTAHARSGWEAYERILELRPKAILLDVNLPGLDGFEVLRRLRAQLGTRTPPVMMLTARNAEADLRNALGLGAKDYLTKPFEDANLLRRVARLVRIGENAANPAARGPQKASPSSVEI